MSSRHGTDLSLRADPKPASRARRSRLGAALLALLVLCGLLGAVAPPAATAAVGKPTAKAPSGTIATATPTFAWSKATGAAKYELRVFTGKKRILKKTGLTKLAWTSGKALPANVSLAWKVRASSAAGRGAWSKSLTFTVVAPASPDKAITAFSFQGLAQPVPGVVNEAAHTVALSVPFGTGVTALVATFTTTGASVAVGANPQVSGVTPNDFTNPVTYRVTAADSSTQAYVVTVTVAGAVIGQDYGGGKIAYILQSGDPGYDALVTHGLVAAAADQSSGIRWDNGSNVITGASGTALGSGAANTDAIIAVQGAPATSYAAGLARAYSGGGYIDWYLPSQDELNKLFLNQAALGGFSNQYYWSSSEFFSDHAYYERFSDGNQFYYTKVNPFIVRAVRSF